jgi:hypothetical protein
MIQGYKSGNMKKMLFRSLGVSLLFVFGLSSFAQPADLGDWLIYFGNKKINSRWNWHHEVQYRNYNAIGDLEQLLLRTGIGYNLSENNHNVLFGYGYIRAENYLEGSDEKAVTHEHRVYQQFITRQRIGRVYLQHRYRLEQRWLNKETFKMRYRYFLSARIPLNQRDMGSGALYASAYNELFINDRASLFDRNRLYGGIGYQFNTHTNFELGYMNQFFEQGGRDQLNLILFFSF